LGYALVAGRQRRPRHQGCSPQPQHDAMRDVRKAAVGQHGSSVGEPARSGLGTGGDGSGRFLGQAAILPLRRPARGINAIPMNRADHRAMTQPARSCADRRAMPGRCEVAQFQLSLATNCRLGCAMTGLDGGPALTSQGLGFAIFRCVGHGVRAREHERNALDARRIPTAKQRS